MHKKRSLLAVVMVLALLAGFLAYRLIRHESVIPEPEYKMVTGYNDGNFLYSCSRPIKAKLQSIPGPYNPGGNNNYTSYIPIDLDEAKLLCQSNAAIENEGKIKVLQKPEVIELLNKYQYKDVTIKALEFKYIKDPEYVNRLLPAYSDKHIGCIIVLETPGERKVYFEDEQLNTFEELDYQTFTNYLQQASPADRQTFYDNLK